MGEWVRACVCKCSEWDEMPWGGVRFVRDSREADP